MMFIIPINCPIVRHRIHFIVQEQHRVYGLRSRLLSHALRFNWNSWPSAGLGSWPVDALAGYSSADRHSFRVIHNNIIGRIKDALLWANILGSSEFTSFTSFCWFSNGLVMVISSSSIQIGSSSPTAVDQVEYCDNIRGDHLLLWSSH